MTFNYKHLFTFCIISILATSLFVGQYYDHHGDRTLFIKHRPTFRQMFSLHSAEQSKSIKLTVEQALEELENEEFVSEGKLEESNGNIILPAILIQISIMLLVSASFAFFKKATVSWLQLVAQFLISICITAFGIFYMLWADNLAASFIWIVTLLITNFLTIILINRLRKSLR